MKHAGSEDFFPPRLKGEKQTRNKWSVHGNVYFLFLKMKTTVLTVTIK